MVSIDIEGIINNKIKEGVNKMSVEQGNQQFKQDVRGILRSVIQVTQSKWSQSGYRIDGDAVKDILVFIQEDPRTVSINRHVSETRDLHWYQTNIQEVVNSAFSKWVEDNSTINAVDPKDLPLERLLDDLRTQVVRLVFIKKGKPLRDDDNQIIKDANGQVVLDGGQKRVMWATRNPDLIALYDKNYRTRGAKPRLDETRSSDELDKDYLTVLDLEIEEFRTFKPSTLLAYDDESRVGSWVAFDIDNDAWYRVLHEGDDISRYYQDGHIKARLGERSNQREIVERDYLAQAIQSGSIKSPQVVEFERANRQAFLEGERQYLSILSGTYQDNAIDTAYEGIKDFLRQIHQDVQPDLDQLGVGDLFVSKQLQRRRTMGNSVNSSLELTVGDAIIVFSPYYIVNTKTGHKYLDRYDLFRFGLSRISQEERQIATISDQALDRHIERLIDQLRLRELPKPTKRKRILSEKDMRRLNRLNYLYQNRNQPEIKEYLAKKNVALGYIDSRELFKLSFKGTGVVFTVNSRNIGWQNPINKQPEMLVSIVKHTSALKEFRQVLNHVSRNFRQDPKVVLAVKQLDHFLLEIVFNLRIKEDEGIRLE